MTAGLIALTAMLAFVGAHLYAAKLSESVKPVRSEVVTDSHSVRRGRRRR